MNTIEAVVTVTPCPFIETVTALIADQRPHTTAVNIP